ncbi:hypothetical protein CBS101457_000738 [Exobasidium rhododendri]|nr:hypothetical protein CBS101457_000738 [Exobasidium rhododendri]
MMRFTKSLAAVAAMIVSVQAAQIAVQVGMTDDQFSPLSSTAAVGDTILFTFHTSQHNVIESAGTSTSQACQPMAGGFATEIMSDGTTYSLAVNSTDPVYIHCGPHCKSNGMIYVINPPSSGAVTDYQNAAEGMASTSASSSSSAASATMTMAMKSGAVSLAGSSISSFAAIAGAVLIGVAAVY